MALSFHLFHSLIDCTDGFHWAVPQSSKSAAVAFLCPSSVFVAPWPAGSSRSIQHPVAPLLAFSFHILHFCCSCGDFHYLLASPYSCGGTLPAFFSTRRTNSEPPSPVSLATMPMKGTSLLGFDFCTCS